MARRNVSDREPAPCEPGSIEQQLDMCETGPLKGDMAETNREGDEASGDDHSSGLQGGEPELESQPHVDSGTPGERADKEEMAVRKRNAA